MAIKSLQAEANGELFAVYQAERLPCSHLTITLL